MNETEFDRWQREIDALNAVRQEQFTAERLEAMRAFAATWGENAIAKAYEVFMLENAQAFELWYQSKYDRR